MKGFSPLLYFSFLINQDYMSLESGSREQTGWALREHSLIQPIWGLSGSQMEEPLSMTHESRSGCNKPPSKEDVGDLVPSDHDVNASWSTLWSKRCQTSNFRNLKGISYPKALKCLGYQPLEIRLLVNMVNIDKWATWSDTPRNMSHLFLLTQESPGYYSCHGACCPANWIQNSHPMDIMSSFIAQTDN